MDKAEELRAKLAEFGEHSPMFKIVAEEGEFFETIRTDDRYARRSIGQCYDNAYRLSVDRRIKEPLTYAEGFGWSKLGPIQHAWNLDAQGRVIDTTWTDSASCLYFGIAFTLAEYERLDAQGIPGFVGRPSVLQIMAYHRFNRLGQEEATERDA